MKLNIYTIYDVASGIYLRPFFCQADGQAKRSFLDIAKDPEHDIGKHPEDYTLYRIGQYDEREGQITPSELKKLITGLEAQTQLEAVNG